MLRVKLQVSREAGPRRAAPRPLATTRCFAGSGVQTPEALPHNRHVYHIYAIRTPDARRVAGSAAAAGHRRRGIHYPIPVHLLPAYADLGYKAGQFPHSERAAAEMLSLPMFPELTVEQCQTVASAVKALAETNAAAA